MRTLFRGACIASLAVAVVSCGLLKKKDAEGDDAAAEASVAEVVDAAPAPIPGPAAANENDIARFPDETKLESVAATFQRQFSVREAPPAGKVVITLQKGAAVSQIGQRDKYFLVVFDDPKDPGTRNLMGWVHQDAFSAAPVDAVKTLKCGAGELALISDTAFCGKPCSADADCPSGQACKGQANKLKDGKAGDPVTVCTVFQRPDAGGGGTFPNIRLDAGTSPKLEDAGKPPPAPATDIVAPTGGACPTNFTLIKKTGKCHRTCATSPAECKPQSFCVKCDGDKKVCAASREQCK